MKEVNKEFTKLKRHKLKTCFAFKAKTTIFVLQPQGPNQKKKKEHLHINVVMKSNALTVIKSILEKLGEEFLELMSGSKNTLDKITARTF